MCSILRQRVQQEDEDTSFVFKAVSLRVLPDFTNRGDVLLRDIIKYVSLKTTHSLKNIIHCDIYIHILKRRYSSQDNCAIVSLAETIGDIVRITKCDAPNVQSSAVTALAASFYDVKNRDVLYDLVSSSSSSSHLISTCAAISLVRSREKKTKRRKTLEASKRRDRIILSLLQSLRHETRKDVRSVR